MPTLSAQARNACVDAITALLNAGSIQFQTAAHNVVAEPTFGATAFGAADAGVATANAIADDTNASAGTISHAHLLQSDGVLANAVMACSCTVTGGAGDFKISSLVIGAGDTVSVLSMTISQPEGTL